MSARPDQVEEDQEPLPPPPDLAVRMDRWKSELLDTSGRNRMLFFKDTRQTLKLPLTEQVAWEGLVEGDGIPLVGGEPLDQEDDDVADANVTPPPSAPSSSSAVDALAKAVRRLADTNRTFVEEQGVHVLHACIGWLTWADELRAPGPRDEVVDLPSGRKARLVRSPLMFVPVRVEKSGQKQLLVREENAPIEPNITLLHYMRHELGIEPEIDEEDDLNPAAVVLAWRSAVAHRDHWEVSLAAETRIDVFSFKKIALFRELERSEAAVAQQPVLRALCGDSSPLEKASSIPSIRSLDEEVRPDEIASVVPADSSQVRALLAVKSGASIVIQGPPGTGKSQTITNLIADAIASRKKVLFVAEKRAAREIVVRNLERAGVGDVVLHLTEEVSGSRGGAGAKREIADQLDQILKLGPRTYPTKPDVADRVRGLRDELNEYVRHLHAPLSEDLSTPFRLLGRWALVAEKPLPTESVPLPSVVAVNAAWCENALEAAAAIDDLGEAALSGLSRAWMDAAPDDLEASTLPVVLRALGVLRNSLGVAESLVADRNLPASASVASVVMVETLVKDLRAVASCQAARTAGHRWLSPRYWALRSAEKKWLAAGGEPARGDEEECCGHLEEFCAGIREARQIVQKSLPNFPSSGEFAVLADAATPLLCGLSEAESSVAVRHEIAQAPPEVRTALLNLVAGRSSGQSIGELLDTAIRRQWAAEAVASHPALRIQSNSRERLRNRFVKADELLKKHLVATTLNAVAPGRQGTDSVAPPNSELGILRAQITAKRRKPLRWLFSRTANTVLRLKPCIVASPLGVAQFLNHPSYRFDLVVFDEASQIPTADAVIPMSRGAQVVVVGDSKQMPPTAFFDRALEQKDDDETITAGFESVLQECEALLPSRRLLWHYRSRDERLIAFSNYLFYDGSLLTFPDSWSAHPQRGVRFVHVPDAVYGKGGTRSNPIEAERAVDLLLEELRTGPEKDVAVTAMSVAQAVELQNRIESRSISETSLQSWIDGGNRVKNLETIQGDECDVMILSFGYGRDAGGSPVLNFGPLSREDGYRRLNVAVTRAREKMIVVSSLRASDISGNIGSGGQLVRRYLDYAERGPIALVENLRVHGEDVFDSEFEEAVCGQLRARNWQVDTQVGVSKFRIDLGILDPDNPGRYLAGVECDGASYHGSESARDRDIARQEVLERLGWRIFRIWSPEWFANPAAVLDQLEIFLRGSAAPNEDEPDPDDEAEHLPVSADGDEDLDQIDSRLPPGTEEFFPHRSKPFSGRLDRWAAQIVASEGPLHEDELLAAIRDDLGYNRIGPRLRAEWLNAIATAVHNKLAIRRSKWLWPVSMEVVQVPVWVNLDDPRRKFEFYSDEELLRAMQLACSVAGSVPIESLSEATAKLLGFKLMNPVRVRLESLVPRALAQNWVKDEGSGLIST